MKDMSEINKMFDEGWCKDCLTDLKDCVQAGRCLGRKEEDNESAVQSVSRRFDETEGDR